MTRLINKKRIASSEDHQRQSSVVFVYVLATILFFSLSSSILSMKQVFSHFIHHITSHHISTWFGSARFGWCRFHYMYIYYKISKDGLLHLFWFDHLKRQVLFKITSFILLILSILYFCVHFQRVNTKRCVRVLLLDLIHCSREVERAKKKCMWKVKSFLIFTDLTWTWKCRNWLRSLFAPKQSRDLLSFVTHYKAIAWFCI